MPAVVFPPPHYELTTQRRCQLQQKPTLSHVFSNTLTYGQKMENAGEPELSGALFLLLASLF